MNLVQLKLADGGRAVAGVEGDRLRLLDGVTTIYDLARQALDHGSTLAAAAAARLGQRFQSYDAVLAERRILSPVDHPDPAASAGHRHRPDASRQRRRPSTRCTRSTRRARPIR